MQNLSHFPRISVLDHVTILLFSPRQPLSYLTVARVYLMGLLVSQPTSSPTGLYRYLLNTSCASDTQQPCKVLNSLQWGTV